MAKEIEEKIESLQSDNQKLTDQNQMLRDMLKKDYPATTHALELVAKYHGETSTVDRTAA